MAEILCFSCVHFAPALDPNIAKAFIGGCKKWEAPFTLILKEGVTECALYERGARVERPAATAAAAGPAAAKGPVKKRVELYYSSKDRPAEAFACDRDKALELLQALAGKGFEVEARDLASARDVFPIYHKAVSGPSAAKRAVFGMKGALEEDFGRRVPALMVFEGDRYPAEVFPRMDRELNRVIGVEEALQRLVATAPA
ncbi:MAG: hypothetical protein HY002_04095 [Candidatus Rokubacteria bacterium]|nr:hypothetical protein [Candidatus Rokubacteria bacterium]